MLEFGLNLNAMARSTMVSVMHDFFWNIQAMWRKQTNFNRTALLFFLGGSTRFGYASKDSDIDFFVYPDSPPSEDELYHLLFVNGFRKVEGMDLDHDGYGGLTYYNKKFNIHVIVSPTLQEWEELRNKHEKIDKFVTDNPKIVEFIKGFKCLVNNNLDGNSMKGKGRYIFRALLELADSNS